MIGIRKSIERGMRHRWLGPLFVILFCLLLAMVFVHAMHDGHDAATDVAQLCLALTVMFSFLIVIRLRWRVVLAFTLPRLGRAPPAISLSPLGSALAASLSITPPLRL